MENKQIRILGISGSLRPDSSNAIVLKVVEKLLPDNVIFTLYNGIGQLPHFDGSETVGEEVASWRKAISKADGIIICTPEYAFGVPGSLKNALDWTVYTGDFVDKPVALITASSQGQKGHASLLQTLTALSANISDETTLLISFIRAKINEQGAIKDDATFATLQNVVTTFISKIRAIKTL